MQVSIEKASLQQNVESLQNSSSDTNSEVHRLSVELQQKQKSYEELVDKSNSIQLSLEKKLHETTQNLAARTTQWEGVKNEMETLTMQKIDRENELNLELSKMKEAAVEERDNLAREIDVLKVTYQEEKARMLKEIDEQLKDSEALRRDMNNSIQSLEKTVVELRNDIEKSKNETITKEEEFNAKMKSLRSIEEDLKKQLDESNKRELELKNNVNEVTNSGTENVEQLTKQLNEKNLHSKELESQLEELKAKYQKTTVEYDEIKVNLLGVEKEKEDIAKTHSEDTNSFTEIKLKLEHQLMEAISKFKSTEDEQVDLVNRNVEIIQQVDQLTKDNFELNNSKNGLNEQLTKTLTEFEAFKLSVETAKSEVDAKLAESLKRDAENNENIKLLESQNNDLKHSIEAKAKELEATSSSLLASKTEFETLKSEAATSKESTEAQINSMQHEAAEHIKTIRSLEDKIDQLTSSVNLSDDLKNELSHKSEEIKSKETNIAELSSTVNALKEQINIKEKDLKRLVDEKEMEEKRSMDIVVCKDEEIKAMQAQFETVRKSLDDKIADFAKLSEDKSSVLLERNSLVNEISRLTHQIQEYTENFVDRTELNNLKEEFSIYEETKQNEIAQLTKKLFEIEERLKNQSAGVDKLEILERKQKDILYEKTALERREAQLVLENKQLADKLLQMKVWLGEKFYLTHKFNKNIPKQANSTPASAIVSDDESGAQISFLNSIIADMQRKNETLTHRIQALESAPSDFVK